MATFHRLIAYNLNGSGTITLNPANVIGIYEKGDIVNISVTMDPGFTFIGWFINGFLENSNPAFNFTMPASDVFIYAVSSGIYNPVDTFGTKYFFEWDRPRTGRHRLEIQELGFTGTPEEAPIQSLSYSLGSSGSNQSEEIKNITQGSRLSFTVPAIQSRSLYYIDLLDYNPFKFRVKYYQGYNSETPASSDWKWTGYMKTEFYEQQENDLDYPVTFTASDGLNNNSAFRIQLLKVIGFKGIEILSSFLRQNWLTGLPIATCVEVHESRMDRDVGVFEQFSLNPSRFQDKSTSEKYDSNGVQFNPYTNLRKGIEFILSPWFCRIYQWDSEWVVLRIPELLKENLQFHKYNQIGVLQSSPLVTNTQPAQNLYNANKKGALAFNEFEVLLELGNTAVPKLNELIKETFDVESWFNYGGARWYLVNWEYINTTWFDGVRDGEVARLQWVTSPTSGESGVFARFWGTANGAADSNLSAFVYKSQDQGKPGIAEEAANKVSLVMKYQILRRGSSDAFNPPAGSHKVGFALKVGSKWLEQTGETTFSWSATHKKVLLDPKPSGVFHTIQINGLEVPEDGDLELYVYQLITISGTRHRYIIDWDTISLNLEQNEDIINSELVLTAIGELEFASKADPYKAQIGDAFTNLSASAIKIELPGNPVSELWTRDGIETPKILLEIILREFVNILGKPVEKINGMVKQRPNPSRVFAYDGKKWLISAIDYEDQDDTWIIDLLNLD
jgi:hypothetical protein